MVSPVREASQASQSIKEASAETLAELRDSVSAIAGEVAEIASKRARAAGTMAADTAEAGAAELRRGIRKQPVLSMGAAAAIGAVLALLIVPRFSRQAPTGWDRLRAGANVTRDDLYDLADNIQRSVSRAAHSASAPIAPALERMVDALTRTDAAGTLGSLLDRVGGWMGRAQAKAKEKIG